MAKIRKTASIERGIEEVVKILNEEEIQQAIGKSVSYLRKCSDPDLPQQIDHNDSFKLDKACIKKDKAPPLATEWVKENSTWFNKPGFRKETAMAYGIDAELTEEGWDVHDPGYYDEMNKRLKASGLGYFTKSEENLTKTLDKYIKKESSIF